MLYSTRSSLVLGFHGCDKVTAEKVFAGKEKLKPSKNDYDWLGHGIYFWENNPQRAFEYAQDLQKHSYKTKGKVFEPAVIGAIIDLGRCLDLLESKSLQILKEAYSALQTASQENNIEMPVNKPASSSGGDLLLRHLDCLVIQTVHSINKQNNEIPYSSVRGAFWEGKELYPDAGFKEKNHIQISIINPNCIKGYFRVIEHDPDFLIP